MKLIVLVMLLMTLLGIVIAGGPDEKKAEQPPTCSESAEELVCAEDPIIAQTFTTIIHLINKPLEINVDEEAFEAKHRAPHSPTIDSEASTKVTAADLYYMPMSNSAANFFAAYKAGILGKQVHAHKVVFAGGPSEELHAINPKENIPCLILDGNIVLNENAASLLWIADQNPSSELAPCYGASERYLLEEKLIELRSEVDASIRLLFDPSISPEVKKYFRGRVSEFLKLTESELNGGAKKFLVGDKLTVADIYLYNILPMTKPVGINIDEYPFLKKYYEEIASMDFIKEAQAAMDPC